MAGDLKLFISHGTYPDIMAAAAAQFITSCFFNIFISSEVFMVCISLFIYAYHNTYYYVFQV